jgi:hypothetical protein
MSFWTKVEAKCRRSTINSCAGGPGGPAAKAIKIAWSLNSWDECDKDMISVIASLSETPGEY